MIAQSLLHRLARRVIAAVTITAIVGCSVIGAVTSHSYAALVASVACAIGGVWWYRAVVRGERLARTRAGVVDLTEVRLTKERRREWMQERERSARS